jgi:hypothetical protein
MLKQLINQSNTKLVSDLNLNWDEHLPLMELFKKKVEDENLLCQLEQALKHLCVLDHKLDTKPSLRHHTDFQKELKSAMNSLLVLIIPYGYRGVALMKFTDKENFYIEIGQEPIYVLKDFNFYFK